MSIQAMSWVINHSPHKGSELLCLIMIADHASPDGTNAYPSIKRLARYCRMSERQVTRIVRKLETSGAISVDRSEGRKSHVYTVNMVESEPVTDHDMLSGLNHDRMSGLDANPDKSCCATLTSRVSNPDIAMSPYPLEPLEEEPLDAAAALPDDATDAERYAVQCVLSVRGAEKVPPADILNHIRECLDNRGAPLDDNRLRQEMQGFRDYWTDKRSNQPKNRKWKGWKRALTNWFKNIRDRPANGRAQVDNDPASVWLDYAEGNDDESESGDVWSGHGAVIDVAATEDKW